MKYNNKRNVLDFTSPVYNHEQILVEVRGILIISTQFIPAAKGLFISHPNSF